MFMQEIKKGNKSLEGSYEELEFIQEACRDQGIAEGMKKRVNVEEICQRRADVITQTKQVPQTCTTAWTGERKKRF